MCWVRDLKRPLQNQRSLSRRKQLAFAIPSTIKMKNIYSNFNKFFHIPQYSVSNKKRPMAFLISHFAGIGLFNSLHSTFTSYKAPKMKLNSNACHTAKDLYCQQKSSTKKGKKRDSKYTYLLRLVVLFSSHLSEALRGGTLSYLSFYL